MGEGLGLAYQASRPREDKSYDIIKEQIAYIQQEKGLAEAAKRQAAKEQRERVVEWNEKFGVLKEEETFGWLKHSYKEGYNKINEFIPRLGAMYTSGDPEMMQQAITKMNGLKSGLKGVKDLVNLMGENWVEYGQNISGDDKFMPDPVMNNEVAQIYDQYQKGDLVFNFNNGNSTYTDVNGKTYTVDELNYIMNKPLVADFDERAAGVAIAENLSSQFKNSDGYTEYDRKTWAYKPTNCNDCQSMREKAIRSVYGTMGAVNRAKNDIVKYIKNAKGDHSFNVKEMSEEEYMKWIERYADDVVQTNVATFLEVNTDDVGKRKDEVAIANTQSIIADRKADNKRADKKLDFQMNQANNKGKNGVVTPVMDDYGNLMNGTGMYGLYSDGQKEITVSFSKTYQNKPLNIGEDNYITNAYVNDRNQLVIRVDGEELKNGNKSNDDNSNDDNSNDDNSNGWHIAKQDEINRVLDYENVSSINELKTKMYDHSGNAGSEPQPKPRGRALKYNKQ